MVLFTASSRRAAFLRTIRLALLVPVVSVLGHDAVFATTHGLGRDFSVALARGNHDGWWGTASAAVLLVAVIALVAELVRLTDLHRRLARLHAPGDRRGRPSATRLVAAGPGYRREWLQLWSVLTPIAAAVFVVQEEIEHRSMGAAGHGVGILFGPEHPLALPVLALVAGSVAAVAALIRWRVRVLETRLRLARPAHHRRRTTLTPPAPAWALEVLSPARGRLGIRLDAGRAPPVPA